jgi:hypothetical protein
MRPKGGLFVRLRTLSETHSSLSGRNADLSVGDVTSIETQGELPRVEGIEQRGQE